MSEKVTIAKIAEACGTSIGTVDRALNKRNGISPRTRQLVLETAERMGYRTNKLAGALSRRNLKRIALIYPDAPRDFYDCVEHGAEKAARDISIYGVEVDSFRYGVDGAEDERRVLESIDIEKYDGIAFDPLNADSEEYVRRFTEAGKPVALFDNDLPKSPRLFFVGSNALQSGKIGGDIIGFLMRGRGSAAVLGNFIHSMPFISRFEGFCQVMAKYYPDINICTCADCRHSQETTEKNIENFIRDTEGNRGIFCTSNSSTIGAVKALEKLGRSDISLVGYDLSPRTSIAVKDGRCKALLHNDPYRQAYLVLELLSRHILEGWVSETGNIAIPTCVVFRQNIDEYSSEEFPGGLNI